MQDSGPGLGSPVQETDRLEVSSLRGANAHTAPVVRVAAWTVLAVTVVVMAIIGNHSPADASDASDASDAASYGYQACKDDITPTLTSPSSASWQSAFTVTTTNLGNQNWQISGYLDADNAFGAKIRSYFTCDVTAQNPQTWTVTSVSGLGG